MEVIAARYTDNTGRAAVLRFMADDSIDFATIGEFSDDELLTLAAAEAGVVDGFSVSYL